MIYGGVLVPRGHNPGARGFCLFYVYFTMRVKLRDPDSGRDPSGPRFWGGESRGWKIHVAKDFLEAWVGAQRIPIPRDS